MVSQTEEKKQLKYFDSVSKILSDFGNLPVVISNLLCDFFILKPVHNKFEYGYFDKYVFLIRDGRLIEINIDIDFPLSVVTMTSRLSNYISISYSEDLCVALRRDKTIEIFNTLSEFEQKNDKSKLGYYLTNNIDIVYATTIDGDLTYYGENKGKLSNDVICIHSDGSTSSMKYGKLIGMNFVMFSQADVTANVIIGLKSDGTLHYLNYPNNNVDYPSDVVDYSSYDQKIFNIARAQRNHQFLSTIQEGYEFPDLSKYSNIKSISCGTNFIIAIKYDGTVFRRKFGKNCYGRIMEDVLDGSDFASVHAKYSNSVVRREDGTTDIWKVDDESFPVPIPGKYSTVRVNGNRMAGIPIENSEQHYDRTEEQLSRSFLERLTTLINKVFVEDHNMTLVEYKYYNEQI